MLQYSLGNLFRRPIGGLEVPVDRLELVQRDGGLDLGIVIHIDRGGIFDAMLQGECDCPSFFLAFPILINARDGRVFKRFQLSETTDPLAPAVCLLL